MMKSLTTSSNVVWPMLMAWRGKELAALVRASGQFFLQRRKVRQPEAVEQPGHPGRQGVEDLLEIRGRS